MSPVVPESRDEIHAPMHHDHERPLESSGSRRIKRRPPSREMVADELFIGGAGKTTRALVDRTRKQASQKEIGKGPVQHVSDNIVNEA